MLHKGNSSGSHGFSTESKLSEFSFRNFFATGHQSWFSCCYLVNWDNRLIQLWSNLTNSAHGVNFKKLDRFYKPCKMSPITKRLSFLEFKYWAELVKSSHNKSLMNWSGRLCRSWDRIRWDCIRSNWCR